MALLWHVPRAAALLAPYQKVVAAVLALWWVFGVGFLTFGGPFATPNNGYFAAWAATVCSWVIAYDLWLGGGAGDGDFDDVYNAAADGEDGTV